MPRKSSREMGLNNNVSDETKSNQTINELLEIINSLKKEIDEIKGTKEEKEVIYSENDSDLIDIRPDAYIKVISLTAWNLSLSTKGYGKGKIYTFREFGEMKRIPYADLIEIMESHPEFLREGHFYIANDAVIKKHGLQEYYKHILDKEKIEQIVRGMNPDLCISLYKSATDSQKEVIITLLVERIVNNPDNVNMNFVEKMTKITGIDIAERARDIKRLNEMLGV
ncbi:MAG: hypothetical protein KatS3mg002_1057 [Candidatus Woesearchaeota archaeon]|jgi:hypothetical protein|nr:MAG: hypothetical protein KatS3mg002_1057 [Candidatus Woesearchaeota archaeon]